MPTEKRHKILTEAKIAIYSDHQHLFWFRNKLILRLTKLEEENIKVIHISFDNLYRPSADNPYVEDYDSEQIKNLFGQINKYYENSQEVNPISKIQSVFDEKP